LSRPEHSILAFMSFLAPTIRYAYDAYPWRSGRDACGDGPCQTNQSPDCTVASSVKSSDWRSQDCVNPESSTDICLGTVVTGAITFVGAVAAIDSAQLPHSWSSSLCSPNATHYTPQEQRPFARSWSASTLCAHHTIADALIYSIATTILWHINRQDRFQDSFLFGGITSGIGIGLATQRDIYDILVTVMPWTILLSLAASSLISTVIKITSPSGTQVVLEHSQPRDVQAFSHYQCKENICTVDGSCENEFQPT
jgi:hypothetical protein